MGHQRDGTSAFIVPTEETAGLLSKVCRVAVQVPELCELSWSPVMV